MTEKRRYSRSISQMKSVTRCGEAFAISRGFRGPRPSDRPWAQTVAGIAFHEALVLWEKSGRAGSLLSYFDPEWEKALEEMKGRQPDIDLWMVPPGTKYPKSAISGVYKRFVEKDVPNYEARCREAEWEIYRLPSGELALELPYKLDLDGVPIQGQIDRIQWWPNLKLVSIEDTKSGSPKEENDPRQLGLYRLAALEQHGIELTHGRYWFTKLDRGSEWTDLRRFTRKMLEADYRRLDTIIDQDLLLPNPGEICAVCDVRPYCSIMGWLKPGEPLTVS